jgi:hypothetical protein
MSLGATGYNTAATGASRNVQDQRFGYEGALAIPSDLKTPECRRGYTVLRQPVKIRAEQTTYTTNANNEIIIAFPNDAFYDTRRGYLTFDVNISTTGGGRKRLAEGVWCMLYRLRMLIPMEVENIQEYNRFYTLMWEMRNEARQAQIVGRGLMGIGTPAERDLLGATTTHYVCPLISGLLDNVMIPFRQINSRCELRLTLDDPTKFVETDGTNPVVSITNVQLHVERIVMDPTLNAKFANQFATAGLKIYFNTFNYFSQTVSAGAVELQTLTINNKYASLLDIIQIWIPQNTINNMLVNDKFRTWPKLSYKHQYLVNGVRMPEEPVTYSDINSAEAFLNYCNWLRKWTFSGNLPMTPVPVGAQEFSQGSKFITIIDMDQYPYDDNVINPMSNESDAIQFQFDTYITNPLAVAHSSIFFTRYGRAIYVSPGGVAAVAF